MTLASVVWSTLCPVCIHIQLPATPSCAYPSVYLIHSLTLHPSVSAGKRTFDLFEHDDQENAAPVKQLSNLKKVKGSDGEAVKNTKVPLFNLNVIEGLARTPPGSVSCPTVGVKPKKDASSSMMIPAGRSPPKAKRVGILSRRRLNAKAPSYARVNPPTYACQGPSGPSPLSLAGVLSGSSKATASRLPAAKPDEKKYPKKWAFIIHEDTEQEESTNMMEHYACTLDISDDEGRAKAYRDIGKENVPPADCPYAATAVRPVARRDMMTEEVRTPLGDMNPAEFYATGCDKSSVVNVPQEALRHSKSDGVIGQKPSANSLPPVNFDFNANCTKGLEEEESKVDTWLRDNKNNATGGSSADATTTGAANSSALHA